MLLEPPRVVLVNLIVRRRPRALQQPVRRDAPQGHLGDDPEGPDAAPGHPEGIQVRVVIRQTNRTLPRRDQREITHGLVQGRDRRAGAVRANLREPADLLLAYGRVVGERETVRSQLLDQFQHPGARAHRHGHRARVHAHDIVEHGEGEHALGVERGAVWGQRAAHRADPAAVGVRPLDGFFQRFDGFRLRVSGAVDVLGAGPVGHRLLLGVGGVGLRAGPERNLQRGERGGGPLERVEGGEEAGVGRARTAVARVLGGGETRAVVAEGRQLPRGRGEVFGPARGGHRERALGRRAGDARAPARRAATYDAMMMRGGEVSPSRGELSERAGREGRGG
mmetsp:Transcript_9365/g.42638  ORF Transcript_9365/g.42638 Transcript_9365/m.42638 type:complete len:337 (-) Transcript_9365:96-1106(-)